jgi:hypothetical protein
VYAVLNALEVVKYPRGEIWALPCDLDRYTTYTDDMTEEKDINEQEAVR